MATNFKRFNNGTNFVNLELVVKVEAPNDFSGAMKDVKFYTADGAVITVNMDQNGFASLGLPVA